MEHCCTTAGIRWRLAAEYTKNKIG